MIIYSSQRLQKVVNKIRIEEDSIRRSNHDRKIKLDQVKKGNDPKHRWHVATHSPIDCRIDVGGCIELSCSIIVLGLRWNNIQAKNYQIISLTLKRSVFAFHLNSCGLAFKQRYIISNRYLNPVFRSLVYLGYKKPSISTEKYG